MKESFQDLLFSIPMHQLSFFIPLPKKPLYYKSVTFSLSEEWFSEPTLLIIQKSEDVRRLNDVKIANQLVQDPNLTGVVVSVQGQYSLHDDILLLFQKCGLPLISVEDQRSQGVFFQQNIANYSYGRVSMELNGFMERGFVNMASQLALALGTPLLYFDENNQLVWQTGEESELHEAYRWVNTHRQELEQGESMILPPVEENQQYKKSFDIYSINVAGYLMQKLVASSNLADWQKRMIDKFTGLTALLLETEGMLQEQQQQFKEHFVYDLLYHKFESKKVMVKQAKTWGWNLAMPHHLLVVDAKLPKTTDGNWLNAICIHLENKWAEENKPYIVFPFQDQIIILVEDGQNRTVNARKNYVLGAVSEIEIELSRHLNDFEFQIGIGKWYRDTLLLNKSYQEARLALKFGQIWLENRHVFHIYDLGVLRLLTHVHQEILGDFCHEYLSLLIENDKMHGTKYIETLKAYIQHGGIINDVSDALYIHSNTLRNRIKKIEEMTGIDLQDPEEFMNLIVAIKIQSLLSLK